MQHTLKTEREFFNAVSRGSKTFEVRKNDRNFKKGDYLKLVQLDKKGIISGKFIVTKVTYVLKDPRFVKKGFAVLGLKFRGQNFGALGFLK